MKSVITCIKCGKKIKPGNTNGLPNGIGVELNSGQVINFCQNCIIEIGKMPKEEKDKFFENLEEAQYGKDG